jgi:hypothetical protein
LLLFGVSVLGLEVILGVCKGVLGIRLVDNVVSPEHGIRFVSHNAHNNPLCHPRSPHVPGGGTPQIMKQSPGNTSFAAGDLPGFTDIADRESVSMEDLRHLSSLEKTFGL